MNYNRNIIPLMAGGILILAFTTILRPFAVIDTGERGVVMYFGKVQKQILDEGIHPVIPIVTKIKPINVRVQTTEVKAKGSSKDLQDVETTIIVNWHIDPDKVNQIYQQVGDINEIVSGIINPAVSEIVKAATAQRPVQNILQERGELKREIDTSLAQRLRRYGIIINDVSLVNFGFSEEQKAQEAAFRAQQAAQEAKAEINRAKGQAEAQKLLRQNLTAEILQQRAIEKWDGRFPVVMTGSGSLPLINIDSNLLSSQKK
jgi:prohibitin 2